MPVDIDALLAGRDRPVLVDCFTLGCSPCAALARRFGVRSVPTLLLFQNGALKATHSGAASRT